MDYGYQTETGDPIAKGTVGAGIEFDWTVSFSWNAAANYQRAITLPAGQPGNGRVFPLSVSEVNRYLPGAVRQATNLAGVSSAWWTRSPGVGNSSPIANVGTTGAFSGVSATFASRGFRPALWVSIEQ